MDFTVDFIMNSLQISLVGIHSEIHNEILFVLISHEIHQILLKFTEFHSISLRPNRISHEIQQITQKLVDFMKSNRMSLQPTGFHMKSTNEIQPHVTEIHRISQYFS